ncbi:glucan biosynthesis protein D [Stappia sp. GBMRC 2046]|uniref:Glucan biosynthesis protein D n=1 Tax=Stappia sediminis TaxID=2692190 RepID=A0A7X3LTZ3_9HYPH|nr:glucan biosynthesis protein [Stappia sediminis]MXN65090.1 glucan biosynthesis protein D [Stappia sediminis]
MRFFRAAARLCVAGFISAVAVLPAASVELGERQAFSFDLLAERAKGLAEEPYEPAKIRASEALEAIDYDAHWKIVFDKEHTVDIADGVPVQMFHMGRYFKEPVKLHLVEGGNARELLYSPDYFDMPEDSPARKLPDDIGFAGFRVMRKDLKTDWISFLGASYFRTDGASRQYGQSARALSIDTGLASPEEFPRFSEFWLGGAEEDGATMTIYALLESRSVVGAYRMELQNRDGEGQIVDVDARLFFREKVERLGIAPLTSMYWYSEANRPSAADWRPEVHDTDGLAILAGNGERIWRPLNNPKIIRTSSFYVGDVKGFGLAQRDREFENYQDDGVFYNRRPSVWIEPLKPFGKGMVQLVELPTDDEIYDNIVAYWSPEKMPEKGDALEFSYRMRWADAHPQAGAGSRVVATRIGQGGVPGQPRPKGQAKVVLDFEGEALKGLGREDGLEPLVELSRGEPINPYLLPVVGTDRWRLIFDAKIEGSEPVEARVYLKRGEDVLSETWLGQLIPSYVKSDKATLQ